MGAEPGRRFLKQPAARLEPVIVTHSNVDVETQFGVVSLILIFL